MRMTLNECEVKEVVDTMAAADFGSEIEIETVDDDDYCEDDGQPSEYDEWQDYYGGDDSIYEYDCDCMFDC